MLSPAKAAGVWLTSETGLSNLTAQPKCDLTPYFVGGFTPEPRRTLMGVSPLPRRSLAGASP